MEEFNFIEIDRTPFLILIRAYYYDKEHSDAGIENIIDLKAFKNDTNKTIKLNITLHRPGLFVGKSGQDMHDLTQFLNKSYDYRVYFYIIEHDLWKNIYKQEKLA